MDIALWFQRMKELLHMPLLGRSQKRGSKTGRCHFVERSKVKLVIIFGILGFVGINLREHHWHNRLAAKTHQITSSDIELEDKIMSGEVSQQVRLTPEGFLPFRLAAKHCEAHKWKPFPDRESRRKVYDLLMINSELDWLEIRLNTMHNHVDYFVVLESATTFTGLPKPLFVKENWGRFSKFHTKIIYHVLENPPSATETSWVHERYQRNAMYDQVFPSLNDTMKAKQGDVILVSDLDEVIRPATLTLLRNCEFPERLTLRSEFYYYSFQWRHVGPQWAHPEATFYQGSRTILPVDLRGSSHQKQDLWNAGWHCSSCFSTIAELLTKMESFSHTELNEEKFREQSRIVRLVREGKDLWGRWFQWYKRVDNNEDIPDYLKSLEMRERFRYMLDRDGEDSGFTDYKSQAALLSKFNEI